MIKAQRTVFIAVIKLSTTFISFTHQSFFDPKSSIFSLKKKHTAKCRKAGLSVTTHINAY